MDHTAELFECDRDTISQWIDAFRRGGVSALGDAPRPERPLKLDGAALDLVRAAVEHPTPNLKATLLDTLKKRFLRELGHPQAPRGRWAAWARPRTSRCSPRWPTSGAATATTVPGCSPRWLICARYNYNIGGPAKTRG